MLNLKLTSKVFAFLLCISVIPLLVASYFFLQKAEESIKKHVFDQLISVRDIKHEEVLNKLNSIRKQAKTLSKMPFVIDAMKNFSQNFSKVVNENNVQNIKKYKTQVEDFYKNSFTQNYKNINISEIQNLNDYFDKLSDTATLLQYHYISNNTYPLDSKYKLQHAGDLSSWSKAHQKYHPLFADYLQNYGYYDIFLIDIETENIVYSVFKEIDFATSLSNGPFSRTNFAECFQSSKVSSTVDHTKIVDMEPYLPSYNFPASFISSPIFDGNKKIGVLVMQIPIDQMNSFMTNNNRWKDLGFGDSGETYLLGGDYKMRSDSRFLIENKNKYLDTLKNLNIPKEEMESIKLKNTTICTQKILSTAAKKAVIEKKGAEILQNYLNISVISAFCSVNDPDLSWALVAERSTDEGFSTIKTLRTITIVVIAILFCCIVFATYIIIDRIKQHLNRTTLPICDELFQLQNQVHDIRNIIENLESAYVQQRQVVNKLNDSLSSLNAMSSVNFENTQEANKIAVEMNVHANKGLGSMINMLNSINNIEKHTQQTGDVLNLIDDVAKETHVVSVNASIRAAREENKSFSIVADEVRKLASKSSQAVQRTNENIKSAYELTKEGTQKANEMSERLYEIQTDIKKTVGIVDEISIASQEQFNDLKDISNFLIKIQSSQETINSTISQTSKITVLLEQQVHNILNNLKKITEEQA